jgi:hypothetical protein
VSYKDHRSLMARNEMAAVGDLFNRDNEALADC